jgi:DNA polymerase III alpha subunit (gram-positive type)
VIIFDTESDDLLMGATKIHIMCWTEDGEDYKTTSNYDLMAEVLNSHSEAGCHNSLRFDFPLFKKIINYDYKGLKIDTLFNSWYLFPHRTKHGLEHLGVEHGVKKIKVDQNQWKEGNMGLMKLRVVEDVKINWLEWKKQEKLLKEMYG